MKHTQILITSVPNTPAPSEGSWTCKITDAGCTTSYVLNSLFYENALIDDGNAFE